MRGPTSDKPWAVLGTYSAGEWETQVVRGPADSGMRWRLKRYNKRGQVVETRISRATYLGSVLDIMDEGDKNKIK